MNSKIYEPLEKWLTKTPLGREILHNERVFFSDNVKNIFGMYSLQIGLDKINMLQGNKITNYYILPNNLIADSNFLPFKSESIDLIVLPHHLEYANNHNFVLQEIFRILAPNGKVLLTSFNKYSWLGLCRKKVPQLKNMRFNDLNQFKKDIIENKFHIEAGKFFSYCPPSRSVNKLRKLTWMNKVGDRWAPTLANSFALILSKKISNINIISPVLEKKPVANKPKVTTVCNKN